MSIIHWPLDKWLDNVALAALSRKETLLATYDIARSVIERGIPGDFVECGVFGGAQCAVMARAIMECRDNTSSDWAYRVMGRRVHLFDSFEGVPAAGPHDHDFAAGGHKAGVSVCSLDAVKQHMTEWGIPDELLVYHPGWFADTMHEMFAIQQAYGVIRKRQGIALLRLDGDLYESTRTCLEYLYPMLSIGGWLIVDDYGLDGARKAVQEYFAGNYPPAYFQRMPE